jgi:hypothetical protein
MTPHNYREFNVLPPRLQGDSSSWSCVSVRRPGRRADPEQSAPIALHDVYYSGQQNNEMSLNFSPSTTPVVGTHGHALEPRDDRD